MKEKVMKTIENNVTGEPDDELRSEYDFDFSTSKPNKYAAILRNQKHSVLLDPDVFQVFDTDEKVNKALRAIISAIPEIGNKEKESA